ncbi:divergent polysaccharide deacetylase family protein [Limobrevibacterium gyesilva]|uniref:Divergent polysaccharide deacetylase family protein n=1 Tax=Limobrevibacterium gyesilva TaxID=2991712 RepID=A0AA41YK09_9PROT|nr:divergent polysaccharide deacetylase family protein [Limobrevibacterium gyesilva]MCW3473741.1 divergent polysaccharide deacetylase family protein [Limobrevibacterium gyesilva]
MSLRDRFRRLLPVLAAGLPLLGAGLPGAARAQVTPQPEVEPAVLAVPRPPLPAWQRFAVQAPSADGKPTIAFMFDDMGLNRPQSERAAALPGPLTLSWMPYAQKLSEQVANGAARGHETMLHMPMEPLGRTNPGPNALRTWLPPETNLAYLRAALDSVPGAIGLNQHEGSVASLSVPLMDLVMGELKDRGLIFVDSLTIPHSVALNRAQAAGIPAVPRDVFLDNSPDPASIRAQIAQVEAVARRYGHAIAIGHPRQNTIDVLAQYLPTVQARGFVLWPVSATVAAQNRILMVGDPAR